MPRLIELQHGEFSGTKTRIARDMLTIPFLISYVSRRGVFKVETVGDCYVGE